MEANLLRQLRRAGGLDIFIHAMLATAETSNRAGNVKGTVLDADEYKRFYPCVAMARLDSVPVGSVLPDVSDWRDPATAWIGF